MKTVMSVLIFLILVSPLQASGGGKTVPANPAAKSPADGLMTLDLKGVPVHEALATLFKNSGRNYMIGAGVSDKIMVSVSLRNVPFDTALKAICEAAMLSYSYENGVYRFNQRISPAQPIDTTPGVAASQRPSDLITVTLPAMDMLDAILNIKPKTMINLDQKEEQAKIEGAVFYQFPRDTAARMLVSAAVPNWPAGKLWVYSFQNIENLPSVAIGAYRLTKDSSWKMTILANQISNVDLISKLFQVTQTPYVLQFGSTPQGSFGGSMHISSGTRYITSQLFDVTLEAALEKLLPAMDLKVENKEGVYEIAPVETNGGGGRF